VGCAGHPQGPAHRDRDDEWRPTGEQLDAALTRIHDGSYVGTLACTINGSDIPEDARPLHITVYVAPPIGESMIDEMMSIHPKRIIFNPGTELSSSSVQKLRGAGIEVEEACTLVLLATNQF